MPFSDWLHNVAVRGCLIAAIVFVSGSLHAENDAGKQPEAAQAQQNKQNPAAPLSVMISSPVSIEREKTVEPDWNKTECGKAQSHDEADLCEQRKMAKAAKQTVTLNKIQVWIGAAGLIALLVTIAITFRATNAAVKSANTAEDAFRRLERPYLFVRVDDLHCLADPPSPHQPYVTCRFVNYGKLPAILRSVAVRLEYKPALPLQILGDHKFYEVIQQGDVSTRPHQAMVQDSKVGQRFPVHVGLVLHGLISYEDPTGAIHTDRFCLRGLEDGAGFRIADEEYNRRKTEYPKAKSS